MIVFVEIIMLSYNNNLEMIETKGDQNHERRNDTSKL